MSDPISNDYSRVSTLPERQRRTAVFETVLRCNRMGNSHSETREYLDMLGLSADAYDIAGRRQPSTPSASRRDPTGRLRSPRQCPSGEHAASPAGGACLPCGTAERSQAQPLAEEGPIASRGECGPGNVPPELPPGCVWCKCTDGRHILTPESSATTYVEKRSGKRNCRAGRSTMRAANRDRRNAAKGLPTVTVPADPAKCRNGIHPKTKPGRCQGCRNDWDRKNARRAA